jgi:hypothetical protein
LTLLSTAAPLPLPVRGASTMCVPHAELLTPPASVVRPPSLPPAPFPAAMAPVHYALSETEQYDGG